MKIEFLGFEETQSMVDADYARKEFVEASDKRFDFWVAHHRRCKTLQQQAWFQSRMRQLLTEEFQCWERWKNLEEKFIAEMTVKFNPPTEEDRDRNHIFTVLGRLSETTFNG